MTIMTPWTRARSNTRNGITIRYRPNRPIGFPNNRIHVRSTQAGFLSAPRAKATRDGGWHSAAFPGGRQRAQTLLRETYRHTWRVKSASRVRRSCEIIGGLWFDDIGVGCSGEKLRRETGRSTSRSAFVQVVGLAHDLPLFGSDCVRDFKTRPGIHSKQNKHSGRTHGSILM